MEELTGLLTALPDPFRRVRVLRPTKLGIKIHDQVLLAAAKKLQKDFSWKDRLSIPAENRRLGESAELFRKGNRTLRGAFQISFFDTNPVEMNSEAALGEADV